MLATALVLFATIGCSSLRTASYRTAVRGYQEQSEGYDGPRAPEPNAKRLTPHGPFRLDFPVETVKITRGFFKAKRPHQGIDFDGERNDPILAAHEGYVIYRGNGFSGFGNMIIIQYSDKWASLYAHLRSFNVREGDYVQLGDVIGKMGRTGRATGTHLHFELLKNKVPIDPLPLLQQGKRLVEASYK
jgi:murein DD-endopeptidase MepM/ murein hydrolase activator NlpD